MGASVRPEKKLLSPEEFAQVHGAGRDFGDAPGIGAQAKAGVQAVGHALAHPVETATNLVTGMASDLGKTFLAPVEGDENTRNAKTGLLPHPALPEGATLTRANTPGILSPEEFQRAGVNTELNAIFMGTPAMGAVPRVGVNAAIGAYNDPDQPVRGAVAGTALGEVLHGAGKLVGAATKAEPVVDQAAAARAQVLDQLGPADKTFIQNDPRLAPVFMPEREPRLPALPRDGPPEPPNSGPPPRGTPRPPVTPEPPPQGGSVVSGDVRVTGRQSFNLPLSQDGPLTPVHKVTLDTPKGAVDVDIVERDGGRRLDVQLIRLQAANADNQLGPTLLRRVGVALRREFPNAETIGGARTSGASVANGAEHRVADFSLASPRHNPDAALLDRGGTVIREGKGLTAEQEALLERMGVKPTVAPSSSFEPTTGTASGLTPMAKAEQDALLRRMGVHVPEETPALKLMSPEEFTGQPMEPSRLKARAGSILPKNGADSPLRPNENPRTAPWAKTKAEYYGKFYEHGTSAADAENIAREGLRTGEAIPAWEKIRHEGRIVPAAMSHRFGDKLAIFRKSDIEPGGIFVKEGAKPVAIVDSGTPSHEQIVRQAVADGKPVPAKVLAEYPDLQPSRFRARVGMVNIRGEPGPLRPNVPRQAKGTPYEAPLDNGADPRLVNVAKLGLSPEGEAQFRSMMPATGEKVTVTHAETEALARELEMDPERLKRRINDWSGAEALAARNVISQNTERIVALSKRVADATTPLAERDAAKQEISRLTTDVRTIADRLTGERSKAGRDLNAYKIIAKSTMDPATWLAQGERVRGGLGLTPEQSTEILRLTGEKDRAGLITYISKLSHSTPLEKGITLWKAGLLTGLRTHEVNVASNVGMAALETAKDIPAAIIDRVAQLVTGEQTVAPSFRGNVIEAWKGTGKGVRAAKSVLRQGDAAQMERWDFRQTNYDNPVLQAYTQAVFRSLGAEDQIARGAAMGRALEEHLRLRASALAKADKSLTVKQHLEALRKNPPDDVIVKAIADAEYAVFQNDNAISRGVSAFKRALPSGGRAAAEVVLPFVKTPTNVALRMMDYSPIGLFTTLAKQFKEPSQRALSQGLGRAVTGSALVWLGYTLAADGKATGASPSSSKDRDLAAMQGSGANRVLLGGKWMDVSRISPAGALVAVGAQLYHATKDAETTADRTGAAAFSMGRVVLDQPFVSGLSSALDAAKDPQHAGGRFLARTAGSVVPTIASDAASALDPKQREVKGIGATIASRVPKARETLPERLDVFGKGMANPNHGAGAFVNFLNSAPANTDPLVAELARLGVAPGKPGPAIVVRGQKVQRTEDDRRALQRQIGQAAEQKLRAAFMVPSYKSLSDEEKKQKLERILNDIKADAYADERRKDRRKMATTASGPR